MSWLGLNGASRDDFQSLGDAYASMYAPQEEEQEQLDEGLNPFKKPSMLDKAKQLDRLMKQAKDPFADTSIKREAFDAWLEEQLELGADFSEFTEEEVTEYFAQEVLGDLTEGIGKILSKVAPKVVKGAGKALNSPGNAAANVIRMGDKALRNHYTKKEEVEQEVLASLADAYNMMYEKKKDSDKCGDDTYWDKEEKKCKSKKKSSKTVVVGRGGIYGPGYHGGGGSNGGGDGDGGDTDGGDGGDGGGDGGGGGE